MEVITRKQAREQGLKTYFTGKPCKHGNLAERGVVSPYCLCRDCRDERNANNRAQTEKAAYAALLNPPTGAGGHQFSASNRPPGYYTYAYLRKDGSPWYIGKGTARRAWDRHGNPKTKKTWRAPSNDRILILKWGLSENQAHSHEIYLIAILGNALNEGGMLRRNFTDGGEGCSGRTVSQETKNKISKANTGRKRPQHLRDRISKALKGRVQAPELVERRAASRRGYRHSQETRNQIRESNRKTKLASAQSIELAKYLGLDHALWVTLPKQQRKHMHTMKARAESCGHSLIDWLAMTRGQRCAAAKRRFFSQKAA